MKSAARSLAAAALVASALLALGSTPAAGSSGSPATCGARAVSQPFLAWNDHRHYFTALGLGGKWLVDDISADPFKDR